MNNADSEYIKLVKLVLNKGKVKQNRTGIPTLGVFGAQARFDLSESFPLLTTKKVFFKGIVHELLWVLSGSTNIKYLVDNGVNIWNKDAYRKYGERLNSTENSYGCDYVYIGDDKSQQNIPFHERDFYRNFTEEEFVQNIKNDKKFAERWGELGEGTYGSMWRGFPYYEEKSWETFDFDGNPYTQHSKNFGRVDQISKLIKDLKENPDSRRLIVSAWHPFWVEKCVLPPCHTLFQFHTEELTLKERQRAWYNIFFDACDGYNPLTASEEELDKNNVPKRRLNCQLYQRSCDAPLGGPYNIASYSLLLSMVAQCVNMTPGEFIWSIGDLHIYENQIEGIKEQIAREPRKSPRLVLNPKIKNIFAFKYEDVKIEGYDPHPTIKMPLSVG